MKYTVKKAERIFDCVFDSEYDIAVRSHTVGGYELSPYGWECVYKEAYDSTVNILDKRAYAVLMFCLKHLSKAETR